VKFAHSASDTKQKTSRWNLSTFSPMGDDLVKERIRFCKEDADSIARSIGVRVKAKETTKGGYSQFDVMTRS